MSSSAARRETGRSCFHRCRSRTSLSAGFPVDRSSPPPLSWVLRGGPGRGRVGRGNLLELLHREGPFGGEAIAMMCGEPVGEQDQRLAVQQGLRLATYNGASNFRMLSDPV